MQLGTHRLEDLYTFRRDREKVLRVLAKYPALIPLLMETYDKIKAYFPHSQLFLEEGEDPEKLFQDELFLSIATDMDIEKAGNQLDAFYDVWLSDTFDPTQDRLHIDVE